MAPDSRPIPPLNLKRRFAVTSLAVIVVIALGLGWLLSNMLTQRMLQREGEVTMDFVQNHRPVGWLLPEPAGPGAAHALSQFDGARDQHARAGARQRLQP